MMAKSTAAKDLGFISLGMGLALLLVAVYQLGSIPSSLNDPIILVYAMSPLAIIFLGLAVILLDRKT